MELFYPGSSDRSEYDALRGFLNENGFPATSRSIYRLRYKHHGEEVEAAVGQTNPASNDLTLAIFELSSGSFAVCTKSRGIDHGDHGHTPILVGSDQVMEVEEFE